MTSIPPPSFVAQVWLVSDDHLAVHFPQANDGHGHTIHLSGDIYGLTCMMQILRERQKDGPYTVGMPSTPTQWEVDRAIKKIKLTMGEPKLDLRKLSRDDRDALKRQEEIERRKTVKHREATNLLTELGLI